MSDRELLQEYRRTGSERAFRALVERYSGLVISVAMRRTGSRQTAEDVAQNVFVVLAAKAGKLKSRGELAGWLHRTALLEASNAARKEQAHQRKVEELMEITKRSIDPDWRRISPVLDGIIDKLGERDRSAILLRFYEGLSFREVGRSLGKSEVAARQQVSRALSKMSGLLQRRGITTSEAVLTAGLSGHFAGSVSAATAATISQGAIAGAAHSSTSPFILNTINTMAYAKTKTAMAVALVAAVPIGMQWNENRELRRALEGGGAMLETGTTSSKLESRPVGGGARRVKRAGSTAVRGTTELTEAGLRATLGDWHSALYDPNPLKRSQRIAELLARLDASSAPFVADVFWDDEGREFGQEFRLFARAWGQIDGDAAARWIEEQGPDEKDAAMLAVLGGWASHHPAEAREWAEQVEDSERRERLLLGVIDGWALADFKAAADYAETRPRSNARTKFIQLLLQRSLTQGGVDGAKAWFSGISDNEHNEIYKRRAFEGLVSKMLYRDPAAAAHWITSQAGEKFVSAAPVHKTAMELADTSPQDALDWLTRLDGVPEDITGDGQAAVVGKWARENSDAAGNWLRGQMDHPGYEHMAEEYAYSVAGLDVDGALQWARSIKDEERRAIAVQGVARQRLGMGDSPEDLRLAGFTEIQIISGRKAGPSGMSEIVEFEGFRPSVQDRNLGDGRFLQFIPEEASTIYKADAGVALQGITLELDGLQQAYEFAAAEQAEATATFGPGHPQTEMKRRELEMLLSDRERRLNDSVVPREAGAEDLRVADDRFSR